MQQQAAMIRGVSGLLVVQVMHGDHGIRVNVTLPPADVLAGFSQLELDFELSCPGTGTASSTGQVILTCLWSLLVLP